MTDPEIAPTTRATQCEATTRGGTRCRAYAVTGGTLCRAHSMTEEERQELARAGREAIQQQAAQRKALEDAGRKGLKALLGERLEEEAERLTERLRKLALSEDDSIALRGIELWLSRVHGRAVQPTRDETPEVPADVEALRSLSPEERRALLRSMS